MRTVKTFLAALLILCILIPAAALAEAEEPAGLPGRVLAAVQDADDLIELYEEDLSELIGIEPEDYEDFAYLAARDALSGREIVAVLAVDEEAAGRVEELLQFYLEGRRTETRNYLPDAYALLSAAEVVRADRLVLLVVGEHAAEEIALLTAEE